MSNPVDFWTGLSARLSTAAAGLAGGIVSLAFIQSLTLLQAATSVVVGMLTAYYLTPAIIYGLGLDAHLQNAIAFVIGLSALSILPTIKQAAILWARHITREPPEPPNKGKGESP